MLPLFGPVGPEMLIILIVLVLLFGAQKIPEIGNAVGRATRSWRIGHKESQQDLDDNQRPDQEITE